MSRYNGQRATVAIVQRILPHYRVPFFRELRKQLEIVGIDFHLYYGQEKPGTVPVTEYIDEPWSHFSKNYYWKVFDAEFVFQDLPNELYELELIIVEHAARLINNYLIQARSLCSKNARFAFWGHGVDLSGSKVKFLRRFLKGVLARKADYWFAYTNISRDRLSNFGIPAERISVINNTIDTGLLVEARAKLTIEELSLLRSELGMKGSSIGIYCGGLNTEKRIDLLLRGAMKLRKLIPDFELIIIGLGPELNLVQSMVSKVKWVKHVGAKYGVETVPYFALSKCLLMPGAVGLVAVDSLVLGVPMITMQGPVHGPEISYIQSGYNGLVSADKLDDFVGAAFDCVTDTKLHASLVDGCTNSAMQLSIEEMAFRFCAGIQACLSIEENVAKSV